MCSMAIIVMFEIKQLRLQVRRRPEQGAVQALPPKGPDQPFHERMRQGRVRHRFDIFHFEHPEIGPPLVEPEQWIVIRTEVFRNGLLSNRLMEHSAQRHAIDGSGVNTKSNDAAGEWVHDDQHPMRPYRRRLTSEEIDAPKAVLCVAQKGQPRGTGPIRIRPVVSGKDTANHVLVDLNSESQSDLLGDSGTTPGGIALLHLDHRFNQIFARSFWAGFASAFRGEQQTVLTILHGLVETQKSRRFQYDC